MKLLYTIVLLAIILSVSAKAQDATVQVNANAGRVSVSPYLYGRNNNFSNVFGSPSSAAEITLFKEAGLRFARENNGNNATKYNWQNKLSSHPDWYNNVYDHDWDYACQTIQSSIPSMQAMWAFQLIGKAADNKSHNFNDWGYNQSKWWSGVTQNLAGGGTINPAGGNAALVNGNPALYLKDWGPDNTTAILDHWFAPGGLGINPDKCLYWNMDNEPEIWSGTHDDVMPTQISATAFMDIYFNVAKKARAKFPAIKLCGPVPANEWQWYKWASESLYINGKYYCWLEYFIKRVADEQKASGIRLLDVVDIHWYPGETAAADVVQSYRVFYDQTYSYPGANGVKTVAGGWNSTLTKEYIFKRINDWLTLYLGANHGVTVGMSEFGSNTSDANVNAVLYASMLGTFANNGVDFFSPWSWKPGMWEVLHLYSRYAKNISVQTSSNLETAVSGYSTVNTNGDSLTVILVNRDLSATKSVKVSLTGFTAADGNCTTLRLNALPTTETFVSHASNALKSGTATMTANQITVSLPPLSTTAVLIKGVATGVQNVQLAPSLSVLVNSNSGALAINFSADKPEDTQVTIYDQTGRLLSASNCYKLPGVPLSVDIANLRQGLYLVGVKTQGWSGCQKIVVTK